MYELRQSPLCPPRTYDLHSNDTIKFLVYYSTTLLNVMHTATEDLMTVVTVGSCLKVAVDWSNMFIFTLVQSRTRVDTVQTVLDNLTNSRHICWSHTMKVLGSHVTFVRRNSATVVTLSNICVVMKLWSRMFAVNVQCVSIQQVNWIVISKNTQTSSHFAVVHVVNISSVKMPWYVTLRDVLRDWDLLLTYCSHQ